MARWISAELRQTIAARAKFLCEYCLIAEADTFYGCVAGENDFDQMIIKKIERSLEAEVARITGYDSPGPN